MVGKILPVTSSLQYISGPKGYHLVKFKGGEAELDYKCFIYLWN